jgi:hypothetical protein
MINVKPRFYWKVKDSEDHPDAFDVVVAETITEAIELYLSQYDYLELSSITSVQQLGVCIVEVKEDKV